MTEIFKILEKIFGHKELPTVEEIQEIKAARRSRLINTKAISLDAEIERCLRRHIFKGNICLNETYHEIDADAQTAIKDIIEFKFRQFKLHAYFHTSDGTGSSCGKLRLDWSV
jgi:hypothetical protein